MMFQFKVAAVGLVLLAACDTEDTTESAVGATVTGEAVAHRANGDLIDTFTLTGTTVECSGCLYSFTATIEAVNHNASQDELLFLITDLGRAEGGYDLGLVYIEHPNGREHFWGYAYDDGTSTRVSNADAVLYDNAAYAYEAVFYR